MPKRSGDTFIGVIGCGHWGKNLVRNFHELGVLAAIHDPNDVTSATISGQFDAPVKSFPEILNDPTIMGVAIAAPAEHHFLLAHEALMAGKQVFVEKPLALKPSEAAKLSRLADDRGQVLMVGHLLQYHSAFLKLKEMVSDGVIGRLRYMSSNRLNLGKFRRAENILWSFAPHDISMILSLAGAMPDQVLAKGASFLHKVITDITTTHMKFPGGEHADIHVSWLHPYKEQRLVVIGDEGMLVFNDGEPWDRKLLHYPHRIEWREGAPTATRVEPKAIPLAELEPLRQECLHFLEAMRGEHPPRTDGWEGRRVLQVLEAAEISMHTNRAVDLNTQDVSAGALKVHETALVDRSAALAPGAEVGAYAQILEDVSLGEDCRIGGGAVVGPDMTVHRHAVIGANAIVSGPGSIGPHAYIEAGAFVRGDVPGYTVMEGNPAHPAGFACSCGVRLPVGDWTVIQCPTCGAPFQRAQTLLVPAQG